MFYQSFVRRIQFNRYISRQGISIVTNCLAHTRSRKSPRKKLYFHSRDVLENKCGVKDVIRLIEPPTRPGDIQVRVRPHTLEHSLHYNIAGVVNLNDLMSNGNKNSILCYKCSNMINLPTQEPKIVVNHYRYLLLFPTKL